MNSPANLSDKIKAKLPDLVVIENDKSISILPAKSAHPQVNIRYYEDYIEWQGYWSEPRWGFPLGASIGLPYCNHVIPSSTGKATDSIKLPRNFRAIEDTLLTLTVGWFTIHEVGKPAEYPPIPTGCRLATEEEIKLSE